MSELKYKAAIFDLDGTLLNTLEDIADSMNLSLKASGFPGHDYETYKVLVGDGMDTLVRRALPEANRDEATVAKCLLDMRRQYGRRWSDKTRLYPGISAMLDALVARGVRLAVLSNKPDDFTRTVVSTLLTRWNFDPALGARPDVPKKPDPAGALEIAAKLSLKPAEFLYVGDTNTDMWTATRAGMFALGALWGFRNAEELQSSGANALIEIPADILNFL